VSNECVEREGPWRALVDHYETEEVEEEARVYGYIAIVYMHAMRRTTRCDALYHKKLRGQIATSS
jgi:hypothetical protein